MNEVTKQYWKEEDFVALENTRSMKDMLSVAENIISRMSSGLSQVCGPISTGGKGSVEANLAYFNEFILQLQEKGVPTFYQIPFESNIYHLLKNVEYKQTQEHILLDFYLPLFRYGKIKELHFIPGWESSVGATWEYNTVKELGLEIVLI